MKDVNSVQEFVDELVSQGHAILCSAPSQYMATLVANRVEFDSRAIHQAEFHDTMWTPLRGDNLTTYLLLALIKTCERRAWDGVFVCVG